MADPWLDRAAARRAVVRAARAAGPGFVAQEIARRMDERLEYIVLDPVTIVDIGCGTDVGVAALQARYPRARIVVVRSHAGEARKRSMGALLRAAFGGSTVQPVRAEPMRLPLANASCNMVWSNLALASTPDPAAALLEWARVLAPEGLAMFTSFGPDTLKELGAAFRAADILPHVHPFVDMHDIGDMLVAAGFAQPVIDMEMLTLTYADAPRLFAELRAEALTNVHLARRRTLTGPRRWRRMLDAYAAQAQSGRLPASFEVVYGHAWKAAPRVSANGRAIIRFNSVAAARKGT